MDRLMAPVHGKPVGNAIFPDCFKHKNFQLIRGAKILPLFPGVHQRKKRYFFCCFGIAQQFAGIIKKTGILQFKIIRKSLAIAFRKKGKPVDIFVASLSVLDK